MSSKYSLSLVAGIVLSLLAFSSSSLFAGHEDNFSPPNPADFAEPMDNGWLPMSVGLTYAYNSVENRQAVVNEVTQTAELETIQGIPCTVVHEAEWMYSLAVRDWLLTRETYNWIAWDNWGNVWNFGEDTTRFSHDENGEVTGESKDGSWQAGLNGAQAGILMLAQPGPGIAFYKEIQKGEAEDMALVKRVNAHVNITFGNFKGCLMMQEWSPLDPDAIEITPHAPVRGPGQAGFPTGHIRR